MVNLKRFYQMSAFIAALAINPLASDEPEPVPQPEMAPAVASGGQAKQHIEELDQKLQQLFSKIKTLQEEREQLESMIEAKEDQLEALQEEVVVVLKQRDFYEQELGNPEDEAESPFQP